MTKTDMTTTAMTKTAMTKTAMTKTAMTKIRALVRTPRRAVFVAVAVSTLLVAAGCGGSGGGGSEATAAAIDNGPALAAAKLSLVAYSTPQDAYDKITSEFSKTTAGAKVSFTKSYGASGEQSRAVESGLSADVVAFSLEPDITRLVKKDIVAADWNSGPHGGMVTDSVVVFVVRKGNPKNIRTWDDLIKPGVDVINANPFTSGGARWNVMAAYGQKIKAGAGEQEATDYLRTLFKHISVQDDSARKSLQTFVSGKGDVMLAYENEAVFAEQKGQPVDYVVPDSTILIENPVAVTKTSKSPEQAKAFLDFLYQPAVQEVFADNGYRPVVAGVPLKTIRPTPPGLFTIKDLGGWTDVSKKFFDPSGSVVADIQRSNGISVG